MNQAVVFAFVSMACYGLGDCVYKLAARAGVRADRLLLVQSWVWWLMVLPFAVATGAFVPVPAMAWSAAGGTSSCIGLYLFIRSLGEGSVSTYAPIFRLNFVITVFLVIVVLGEPLTPFKAIGLALTLAATWLLMGGGGVDRRAAGKGSRRSVIQLATGTLVFGASNFFQTVSLRSGTLPETAAVASGTAFALTATAMVYWSTRRLWPTRPALKFGAVTGALLVGAVVCLLHGVAAGQASVVVPITQMAFVISAPLGVMVLSEQMTARKVIGLGAALAALAVLMEA